MIIFQTSLAVKIIDKIVCAQCIQLICAMIPIIFFFFLTSLRLLNKTLLKAAHDLYYCELSLACNVRWDESRFQLLLSFSNRIGLRTSTTYSFISFSTLINVIRCIGLAAP